MVVKTKPTNHIILKTFYYQNSSKNFSQRSTFNFSFWESIHNESSDLHTVVQYRSRHVRLHHLYLRERALGTSFSNLTSASPFWSLLTSIMVCGLDRVDVGVCFMLSFFPFFFAVFWSRVCLLHLKIKGPYHSSEWKCPFFTSFTSSSFPFSLSTFSSLWLSSPFKNKVKPNWKRLKLTKIR